MDKTSRKHGGTDCERRNKGMVKNSIPNNCVDVLRKLLKLHESNNKRKKQPMKFKTRSLFSLFDGKS